MNVAIGILSSSDDIHAIAVKRKIEERHQARCHIIAGKELATKGGLSWASDHDAPSVLRNTDGELVAIGDLDALWYRRLAVHQILPDEADPKYAEHIHASCWTALQGHLMTEFHGRWVSDPVATELGENKLLQLRAAQRAGMRIPATLVSQDPSRIRGFCGAHAGAIIKPLRSRGELAVTAVASAELLAHDDVLALAPAIYQECIPGDRHLRITMFGDRCYAALIEARELDWRVDVSVPFSAYEPSQELEAAMQDVLRSLGLVMGIFDFKLTPEGDIVFFEVNPQGQFLFVEGLCKMPIAESLADYLVEQAQPHATKRDAGCISNDTGHD
jgi:glutathione synthase/RimK-type ligase-like ATP-grasp enzyme